MTISSYYQGGELIKDISETTKCIEDIQAILNNWKNGALTYPEEGRYKGCASTNPLYKMEFLYYDSNYHEMMYRSLPISKESVRAMLSTTLEEQKERLEELEKELEAL